MLWETVEQLNYLIGCALTETMPSKEKVEQMDLLSVYELAHSHCVLGTAAVPLLKFWKENPHLNAETAEKWSQISAVIMRRCTLMNLEREQILAAMAEEKIWSMPLKGAELQHLYPSYGMRQMSDNDILFDPKGRAAVHRIMEERGYRFVPSECCDDMYLKDPFYCFEMHYDLFEEVHETEYAYYSDLRAFLKPCEGKAYRYCFSADDFYVYLMAHAHKHYGLHGTGIRILADCFVTMRKLSAELDWTYIDSELKKLKLSQFEKFCRSVAQKLFTQPGAMQELTAEEQEFFLFLVDSETFGSRKNSVLNRMNEESSGKIGWRNKLNFLFSRVFPDMDYVKRYYPWFAEHRWAMPALWIFRLLRAVFVKQKQVQEELEAIYEAKEKSIR